MVAFQTPTHISGLYADDRIFSRGIVRLSPEELHADEPLLEQIAVPADLLIDNVLEKLLPTPAGSEVPAGDDSAQFFLKEIWPDRVLFQPVIWPGARIVGNHFFQHAGDYTPQHAQGGTRRDSQNKRLTPFLTVSNCVTRYDPAESAYQGSSLSIARRDRRK
jgi:hypothetical protein